MVSRIYALLVLILCLMGCGSAFETANRDVSATVAGRATIAAAGQVASAGGTSNAETSERDTVAGKTSTSSLAMGGSTTAANGGQSTVITPGGQDNTVRVLFVGLGSMIDDADIMTEIELENLTSDVLGLSGYTLRYWLTTESSTSALTATTGVLDGSTGHVGVHVETIVPPRSGADHYLEYSFGTATLPAGAKFAFSIMAHNADWSNFDESDDWSYPQNAQPGDLLRNVTVRHNDVLVWGIEP